MRRLDPYGVVLRFGHWYVVATTATGTSPRVPVDRIDGEPDLGRPGHVRPPRDRSGRVRARRPITYGEDQRVDAHVLTG